MTAMPTFALTSYQKDIWVSESLAPAAPQLTCTLHERLTGPVDIGRLAASVRRALERNDTFRLRFDETDGRPCQWTGPASAEVDVVDLRHTPDPPAARASWLAEAARTRFTARRGRLYQAALLRESDHEVHLHLRAHHLIMDGWGLRQFTAQVLTDYAGRPDALPGPAPYADFVADDLRYRASAEHARDTAAVRRLLSGVRPALFARRGEGARQGVGRTSFVVDAGLVTRLRAQGGSPFPYLTAAFASWLTGLHGTAEVVLGVPLLNRRTAAERATPGMFTSLLPLPVRADGTRPLRELAAEVRESVRTLQDHGRVCLGDVLPDSTAAGPDARRLFDVTLSYLNFPEPPAAPGISRQGSLAAMLRDQDALSVVVQAPEGSPALYVDLEYDRDVFDRSLPAETIGEQVLALLRQGLDAPDSPVAALDRAAGAPAAAVTPRPPAAEPAAPEEPARHVPPRTAMERALAAVWAEVLGKPSVGVHDNYFVLGGDSLTMLRLRAVCLQRGIEFSLTDLMQAPTVARLASRAVARDDKATTTAVAPFELVSAVDRARLTAAVDAFPVSRVQLGLLYHSREQENSAAYHDVFQYTLDLPWKEDAFRQAFDRLVRRHPVLRSSFGLAGYSQPLQIVHPEAPGGLAVTDLRAAPADEIEATVRAHVDQRRTHRYVFEEAPLYLFHVHVCPDSLEIVFSFHHAILDGGSVATLLSELLRDYAHGIGLGVSAVQEALLPSPANYVRDELRALASEEAGAYWRTLLDGAALPQLDGLRPFAPRDTPARADSLHVPLSRQDAAAVRALATERQVPVKSLLFAAYCLALQAQFGAQDYVTGLVTHGRPDLPGAERMVGLFLNSMPVRVDTTGMTWLEVAGALYAQEQRSHPHRRYPLSAVQAGQPSGFSVESCFNYVHFHVLGSILRTPGVRMPAFRTWEETNFKLLVNAIVDPLEESIALRVDYDGRALTRDQAELFARLYRAVVTRMTERPGEQADFGFLSPGLPEAAPQPPAHPDVVRLFADQAARTPDAQALGFGDVRWTYRELDSAAERVAAHLWASGTRPGDRVAIAVDRSPELVALVLGIARAGAASVPLDTGYPVERLRTMLRHARPTRVVAGPDHAHLVEAQEDLLPLATALSEPPGDGPRPAPVIAPEDTAYLLFTSGSTGVPKAVAMPHRSLAGLVAWQNAAPSAAPGGATLQFAPLSFDVSFQEIFSTLCSGGTLVLVREDQRKDPAALLRLIDSARVERVFLPYVALQQLAEASGTLGLVPRRLRVLVSSGEQLRLTDEIRRLCAALPDALLENQYGPTESHVVSRFPLTGDFGAAPALPPIGHPVDGAELHLLDERLRPVPDGIKGELYLGGTCLADGYFGQPGLTAERFRPHPGDPGRTLYRTGDFGVRLPDGAIAYLGRADAQVKVRGFRVEPAEVEVAVLRAARGTGLRDAAVVARTRQDDDAFLAAFLVGDAGRTDVEEIRKSLRRTLPEHLVPTHFTWLDALPLTPSGKRDDAALRRLPLARHGTRTAVTPPRDAYERVLVTTVAELLQLPTVSVDDDLFDLGATSLTVMRLVMLVKQRFGVEIPMSGLIAAPTVADLAGLLRSDRAVATFDPLVPFRTEGTRPPMFFVHPAGGNVLCFVQLAKHLPPDQPFYGLQAAGTEAGTEPLTSVAALAENYLAAIRRVQPHGPYTLGGWSFGGFVALEMAERLRRAGEETADVFLLDTVALEPGERTGLTDDALLGWFFWELLFLKLGSDSPEALVPRHLPDLEQKFAFIAQRAVEKGVLPPDSSASVVRRLFKVYEANWQAAIDYAGHTFDVDFTLLRATQPLPAVLREMHTVARTLHEDAHNGWDGCTRGRLTVVDIPGDHLRIIEEPYVQVVASELTRLTDATAKDRS
ncbi:amino acid adenylation domain-containing protein [Streptomyces sp. NPDC051132]|uniref:non-ribosomal peptide synthetase n=1 Tax=unclassified Streptomyces TaxID=2593676 RepID=UPI0034447E73